MTEAIETPAAGVEESVAPETPEVESAASDTPPDTGALDILDFESADDDTPPATEEKPKFKTAEQVLAESKAGAPKPAEPAVDAKPVEPAAPKAAAPDAKPVEPAAPAAPPAAQPPTQAAQAAPPAEPAAPLKTPTEMRSDIVKQIEQMYTFSDEDKERLQVDPASVLPTLAANLQVNTYEALYYSIVSQLPKMIQTITHTQVATQQNNSKFYEKFPELNKPELAPKLADVAKFWRAQNPNASTEDAIQGIGRAAQIFLGIQPSAPAPVAPEASAAPAPKPRMPSTPAAARAGAGQVVAPPEPNAVLDTLDFEPADN